MNQRPDRYPAAALAFALAAVTLFVAACGGPPPPSWSSASSTTALQAWVTVRPTPAGALTPVVEATVPYRALVFTNRDGVYTARLRVAVTALRDGRQVGGGVATATARVAEPTDAESDQTLRVTVPLQIRGDAAVDLAVAAEVPGTVRTWRRELQLVPSTLQAAPLLVASFDTGAAAGDTLELDARTAAIPLAIALLRPATAPWPADGVEVRSESTAVDEQTDLLRRSHVEAAPAPGDTLRLAHRLTPEGLPFGRSLIRIALHWRQDGESLRLVHEPGRPVVNLRPSFARDDAWRRHVAWLDGKVAPGRRDSLRQVPAPARPAAWRALWSDLAAGAAVGPDALARRHLLRIVRADARFGGYGRGALSDRGRVYVRWGEPDAVEVTPDPHLLGAVWEIWTYREAARRFYFHDAHGMGDFRLRREEPYRP